MGVFARVRDFPVLVLLALELLVSAPQAHADALILDPHLPTLRSLVAHGERLSAGETTTVATEPICDIFANGFDGTGATVCAGCFDGTIDFDETDVDCGGTFCNACADGKQCIAGSDCSSGVCNTSTGVCAPATCINSLKDGSETDVDCGGVCPPCSTGLQCTVNADCQSGRCTNTVCADVLLISQVQTRGDNGADDEFVELYNPTSVAVTFDANWTFRARSAVGSCTSSTLVLRFTGTGQVIPAHGHLLYADSAYNGATSGDASYTPGIPDAASAVLEHASTVVDALCFYYDATTQAALTTCTAAYTCEGTPIANPHNNSSGTNVDASLERKPGGAAGNMTDTGDNATDFFSNPTPDPHNLGSGPTP